MTVEIWSDVVCPFCYIGKRRFEQALKQLKAGERVEVIWRSYQLDPELESNPALNALQSLAERKGWSLEQASEAVQYVTEMAEEEGLEYRYDKTVVANTFDAHRFAHFAKQQGKQSEAEERLFAAYFTEGKNIADYEVLAEIAGAIGLDTVAVKEALASGAYAEEVKQDVSLARQFGVRGVPYFVFDRKYAVSGAQETAMFVQALERGL
ncbi:MAG TPA: DsbA family oxidoreductase [Saprospiraceae bacterium]|nr:DsbA family oxidoreductase [Saprospiraceae bacterium]HMQ85844.1 DsbA family oxidoreductase [Saprospiraceae bacterium]